MQTFPAADSTPADCGELMEVLTAVDDLVVRAVNLTRTAQNLQKVVGKLLARSNEKESVDNSRVRAAVKSPTQVEAEHVQAPHGSEKESVDNLWVRAAAKSPTQVEAEHVQAPHGSRPWWVVYVGREPGLYSTIEEANIQIKGCPNQQYRRKGNKQEALNYYKQMYEQNEVGKWVQLAD